MKSRQTRHILLSVGVLCSLVTSGGLQAQGSRMATDTLMISGPQDTFLLSHQFLVPGSEFLTNAEQDILDSLSYFLDPTGGAFIIEGIWPEGIYFVTYRYFEPPPRQRIQIRALPADTFSYRPDQIFYVDDPTEPGSGVFWETDKIRKSGSLTRGITVGNNRNLSLNSGLRLQLEGDLGDGLKIVGAISDDNIPIQPDGTTQQLSDFDRIFIRLSKKEYNATIGDYEIEQKGTRFANLYRNVQGLQVGWGNDLTKVMVSGAVAKGKFHTNSFDGIDGVSGPYRLTGQNGERFFIVLAGSERVYLNGKLMERGENLDYIINYNTAEIIFTSKHVITNITRIVVDFEYNDQFYNRSLIVSTVDQRTKNDKLRVRFSYARDADNQNAPFSNDQAYALARDTLSQVGDESGSVTTPGIFLVGWDQDEVRYEPVDTLINAESIRYYRYSRDSLKALYTIFFSFVGEGNGNYDQDQSGINANVFTWVAPDANGNPQGSYAPVRSWVLPKLLQVADTRVDWNINKYLQFSNETAVSSNDQNRLSSLGDEDNTGLAQRATLRLTQLPLGDTLLLDAQVSHQYIGLTYQNLDRIYQAEYDRIWDLDSDEERRDETIVETETKLTYPGKGALEVAAGVRSVGPGRLSNRQVITLESQQRKFLQGRYTLTRIAREETNIRSSEWLRQEGDFYFPAGKWRPGVTIWIEDKAINRSGSEEGSFSFTDIKPYLIRQGPKFSFETSFNFRKDNEFLGDQIREKSLASTSFLRVSYKPSSAFQFRQTTAYRRLDVLDSLFSTTGLKDSRTLNTNWQLGISPKERWVIANVVYEVTAEQLAKQEIRYLQVNPGQGQYVWLDSLFNNDGIQDIGEFQLATNPLVADFIRIVVPSRDLSPTTRLSLSGNMRWDFKKLIDPSDIWWKQSIRQLRLNTTLRMTQNQSRGADFDAYLIRFGPLDADSSLLNANYSLRQDLTIFQNSPKGDLRFAWLDNQSLLFLTTGQEQRVTRYIGFAQRLNLNESRSIENDLRIGRRELSAENFPERNYEIPYIQINPKFNVQWNRKIRVTAGYTYKDSRNLLETGEVNSRVIQHRIGLDSRFNLGQRNNIFAKAELVRLTQVGIPPAAAAFEMKEGLEEGINGIWQAFFTWYVLQNVEFSITYDGRASAGTPVIHTGRVQIRAFF